MMDFDTWVNSEDSHEGYYEDLSVRPAPDRKDWLALDIKQAVSEYSRMARLANRDEDEDFQLEMATRRLAHLDIPLTVARTGDLDEVRAYIISRDHAAAWSEDYSREIDADAATKVEQDDDTEEQDDMTETTPQRRRFLHIGQAIKAGQIPSADQWRKAPFVTGEVIAETPNTNPSLHMYTVRVEGTGDIVQVSRLDSGKVRHDYREPEVQEAPKTGPLRRPRWLPHLTEEAQSLLASAGDLHASIQDLEAMTSQVRTMRDDTIRCAISAGATMADVARQLDLTYQAIARIRDRGPRES